MQLPLAPMLATAGDAVPSGDGWRYEVKWDGIRAIAAVQGEGVRVWSRHGTALTAAFPELANLADKLPPGTVLDGELVVCDDEGRPDFRRIRRRLNLTRDDRVARATVTDPATFVAFDLLHYGGDDLTDLAWVDRRERLVNVLPDQGPGWLRNRVYDHGPALWDATREQRLEGVVAKRIGAPYRPGRRSEAWMKVKHTARTALPVVGVRDDAVLVGDPRTFHPVAWVDRFHPSVGRRALLEGTEKRVDGPVGLCVIQHLATDSGGLREALVLALRPLGSSPQRGTTSALNEPRVG